MEFRIKLDRNFTLKALIFKTFILLPLLLASQEDMLFKNYDMDFRNKYMDSQKARNGSSLEGKNAYLFEDWDNTLVIETIDGKSLRLKSANFNITNDKFEIKASKDSVYVLESGAIKEFAINGRRFKKIVKENKIYEFLNAGPNVKLLKRYGYRIKEGAVDPMTLEKIREDKMLVTEEYYVEIDGSVKQVELKKKAILKVFEDKEFEILEFVKKNNLSFKDQNEVLKIMEYLNSI